MADDTTAWNEVRSRARELIREKLLGRRWPDGAFVTAADGSTVYLDWVTYLGITTDDVEQVVQLTARGRDFSVKYHPPVVLKAAEYGSPEDGRGVWGANPYGMGEIVFFPDLISPEERIDAHVEIVPIVTIKDETPSI